MKRLLLAMIRFYRRYISPNKPPCCRYIPTCSQYAIEAIEKYGAIKGGWLAFKRICRCNPFSKIIGTGSCFILPYGGKVRILLCKILFTVSFYNLTWRFL